MFMKLTKKSEAIPRREFHERLREWSQTTEDGDRVGDAAGYGGKPWVWIQSSDNRYHLNADTTHEGVAAYLDVLEKYGEDIKW
jgi:hypothetical protein